MFNPRKNFRGGPKTTMLLQQARKVLPADQHQLLDTPLGFLHLHELQGFAIQTPRGNAAIIVNLGILLHAHMMGRCTLALTSWSSPEPFCRDHEPASFFHALIGLAKFCVTTNSRFLRGIKIWNCPSLGPYDLKSAHFGSMIEIFVLLHEYGHVWCGHLKETIQDRKLGLTRYSQSHAQEYEADSFAFSHLKNAHGVLAAGLVVVTLFRFFDLVEHEVYGKSTATNTHPSGRERWNRLKDDQRLRPDEVPFEIVESMFDMAVKHRLSAVF